MSVNTPAISLRGVMKGYRFFRLEDVSLELEQGQIMGLVGPNGAGKSTTIRILMGLVGQEAGEVRLLGHHMPTEQAKAKRDVGYVSDDMRLFGHATLGWHMAFVRSIYPGWDDAYADALLDRFLLHPEQRIKGLSHGERVKALLLLVLARRPRLLVLDEPTTGLDPVARHEVLVELMAALQDEERSILFSSHNTLDVEQISDQITFIDRGRVIQSLDKETFLERWRRIEVDLTGDVCLETLPGIVAVARSLRAATLTTNAFTSALLEACSAAGATVRDVQRMTLEEIFVASVMHSRENYR